MGNESRKQERLIIGMPKEMKEKIEKAALNKGINMSEVARRIIEQYYLDNPEHDKEGIMTRIRKKIEVITKELENIDEDIKEISKGVVEGKINELSRYNEILTIKREMLLRHRLKLEMSSVSSVHIEYVLQRGVVEYRMLQDKEKGNRKDILYSEGMKGRDWNHRMNIIDAMFTIYDKFILDIGEILNTNIVVEE